MRRTLFAAGLLLSLALAAAPAVALTVVYSVTMTGAQVVGGGDPDGTATGTISINDDQSQVVSWSFTYANIAAPSYLILRGPFGQAGTNADVYLDLGVGTSGGAGTLIASVISGASLSIVNALSTSFYLDVGNAEFPSGALRGQLGTIVPEPGVASLLIAALGAAALHRRARPV